MSTKGQLLQDPFLNALRKEHIPVSIYLVNGIKLQGHIDSFDQYVILLKNSVTQMVYKHAISTVVPARAISIPLTLQTHLMPDQPICSPAIININAAILVSLDFGRGCYAEYLEELRQLAASDRITVSAVITGKRSRPDPALRWYWQGG